MNPMENKGIILYADDDFGTRDIVKKLIEFDFPAYITEFFGDGSSLEERLMKGTENVKLVVTDNEMPGITGLGITGSAIIRKYSKEPGFENIQFVLCYAGNKSLGASLVRDGYAFSFLSKPFGIDDFTKTLEDALASAKKPIQ